MTGTSLRGKLLVFSVFFAGMLAGVMGAYVYETRMDISALAAAADKQQATQSASKKLAEYLELDAPQEQQVEEIMRTTGAEARKLFEPIRPEIESLREQSRARIRAILNEPQQEKYDQWRAERAARSRPRSN
jgi:hypothetical protein